MFPALALALCAALRLTALALTNFNSFRQQEEKLGWFPPDTSQPSCQPSQANICLSAQSLFFIIIYYYLLTRLSLRLVFIFYIFKILSLFYK